MILETIKKLLVLIKQNYQRIAVGVMIALAAITVYTHQLLQKRTIELDRALNNVEYYQSLADDTEVNNKTLQLTIQDFKQSNDSLIQKIKSVQKELKIKDKQLNQATYVETKVVHDTTLLVKTDTFDVIIRPNKQTTIEIHKTDSLLTHKLDIRNDQTLFITTKKVYRHKYKNWFTRLLHFDFKKRLSYEYQIHNTNDLISVDNTRLIEID